MYKAKTITLLLSLSAIGLISCISPKKVTSAKSRLTGIDSLLVNNSKQLKDIEAKRLKKHNKNEIDDTTDSRIQKFISNTNLEIEDIVSKNSIRVGNTTVKREDWNQLKKSLLFSSKRSKLLGRKVIMLSDLINRNTVVKIDQDVVFESGQYVVSSSVADTLAQLFKPAAKEIDLFIRKYPDFPLSLVITAKGYADGTAIAEGSQLYQDLIGRLKLKASPPDSRDLNKELSNARAEAVILLFKKFSASQASNGYNVNNVLYIFEGKGDAFPDPAVQDYKMDDPRRRVVLLFWSLFPE